MFLSNFKNFVKVEGKGDRRYCVTEVSDKKKGNVQYFQQLNLDMGNEPRNRQLTAEERTNAKLIAKHFFHHIMNQDISDFNPEDIPKTDMRKQMEQDSTPSLQVFVRWFLYEYTRLTSSSSKLVKIRARTLFSLYEDLLEMLGYEHTKFLCANTLCKRLKQEFPLFRVCMKRDSAGAYFLAQEEEQVQEQVQEQARGQRKVTLKMTAKKLDLQYRFEPALSKFQVSEETWTIKEVDEDEDGDGDKDEDEAGDKGEDGDKDVDEAGDKGEDGDNDEDEAGDKGEDEDGDKDEDEDGDEYC